MGKRSVKRQPLSQDRQIRALKAEENVYEHSIVGTPGLRIRVAPSGRKTWFFRYRRKQNDEQSGKLEKLKIGEYRTGGMGLAEARSEAERQRGIANEHGSARKHRDQQRRERRAALVEQKQTAEREAYTFRVMATEYLRGPALKLAPKTQRDISKSLERYVYPEIGSTQAAAITRRDVIAIMDKITKGGAPIMANRVLGFMRRMFNLAVAQERVPANPCLMIERNAERAKERALTDTEIRRLLENLPNSGMNEAIADACRLVLLTGLRPGEAAELAFADIDADEQTIVIRKTKNKREHTMPISAQAAQLIERRRKATAGKYLFPSPANPRDYVRKESLPRALRLALPNLKILPATVHDLRRTFATGLARLGAPRILISVALNHKVPGITSVYDRHSYQSELREWVEKWGAHVESLSDPQRGVEKAEAA